MDDSKSKLITKVELLGRIHRSRSAVEKRLENLDEAQLTAPGASGWSIKDHLAHLAVWEFGIAELLHRRPRFAAMQVEDAVAQGKSEDEVNALIYKQNSGLSLSEVLDKYQQTHRRLLEALEVLDDADLYKPYAFFEPGSDDPAQRPVINWIIGNTYAHYDEHNGYIQTIIDSLQRSE